MLVFRSPTETIIPAPPLENSQRKLRQRLTAKPVVSVPDKELITDYATVFFLKRTARRPFGHCDGFPATFGYPFERL